jgi:hypothetical protein
MVFKLLNSLSLRLPLTPESNVAFYPPIESLRAPNAHHEFTPVLLQLGGPWR